MFNVVISMIVNRVSMSLKNTETHTYSWKREVSDRLTTEPDPGREMYEDLLDREERRDRKDYKVKHIKMENLMKSVPQVTWEKKRYWSQGLKMDQKTFEHTRSEIRRNSKN